MNNINLNNEKTTTVSLGNGVVVTDLSSKTDDNMSTNNSIPCTFTVDNIADEKSLIWNYTCDTEYISSIIIESNNKKLVEEYPNNWVLWGRLDSKGDPIEVDPKTGKINKCPLNPNNFGRASANKAKTWGSFRNTWIGTQATGARGLRG